MKKVGGVNTPAVSNLATSQAAVGGIPMRRVGSGGSGRMFNLCILLSHSNHAFSFQNPLGSISAAKRTPDTESRDEYAGYVHQYRPM